MKIAIAGGTGFIGRHLIEHLIRQGDEWMVITRRKSAENRPSVTEVTWEDIETNPAILFGVEAVVNLAGETISQRWTAEAKRRILQSRLNTTRQIGRLVSQMERPPRVVVNGSAIGIYGTSEEQMFTEASEGATDDFLAQVVRQWEAAAREITGTRLVLLRTGLVVGADGGAFPKMFLPYQFGAGGRVGSGRQWVSWIQVEDMVRVIEFCLRNEQITGPVNATAPEPVTNDQFGRMMGRVAHKPHFLPVPAMMLRLLLGEMADLLLKGQKVWPEKLLQAGFEFRYPNLESALQKTLSTTRMG